MCYNFSIVLNTGKGNDAICKARQKEVIDLSLDKLRLENFTAFKTLGIEFSPGINVIIGDNGAGKTHLLKVLYSICRLEMDGRRPVAEEYIKELAACFGSSAPRGLSHPFELFNSPDERLVIDLNYSGRKFLFEAEMSADGGEFRLEHDADSKERLSAVYLPSREMLTHAGIEKEFGDGRLSFDATHLDVLRKASLPELPELSDDSAALIGRLEEMIGGRVIYEDGSYFIARGDRLFDIRLEGEGFKKLALVWRLIATGALTDGSVLFWDEPEANVNPSFIAEMVSIILGLQEMGVQIFLTSHDYFFSKYLDVKKTEANAVLYHAFYKSEGTVKIETETAFDYLENNNIISETIRLYDEEIKKVME